MKTQSARGSSPTRKALFYAFTFLFMLAGMGVTRASSDTQSGNNPVKELTLEQLGNVEVTSVSKAPEQVRKTAAAIFVITQEDIERSGVTNIPDALRLAPGIEVARIDSSQWSVGIRGFGSRLDNQVIEIFAFPVVVHMAVLVPEALPLQ
jgi:iron complex outermembrane receptor protein